MCVNYNSILTTRSYSNLLPFRLKKTHEVRAVQVQINPYFYKLNPGQQPDPMRLLKGPKDGTISIIVIRLRLFYNRWNVFLPIIGAKL